MEIKVVPYEPSTPLKPSRKPRSKKKTVKSANGTKLKKKRLSSELKDLIKRYSESVLYRKHGDVNTLSIYDIYAILDNDISIRDGKIMMHGEEVKL